MNKLYKIEDTVKEVLTDIPETRDDDFKLIAEVYYKLNFNIAGTSFAFMMLNHNEYGLPPFESITRARRKLQATYKELRATENVQNERTNIQGKFIRYAIDDSRSTNFKRFIDQE